MELIYGMLIAILATPAATLIGCAVIETFLMKNRPQLSWLLPAVVMLASALIRQGAGGGSGLDDLLWSSPAFHERCASFGTAAGAAIGAVLRWFSEPKQVSPA